MVQGHETHRAALDERNLVEAFQAYGEVDAAVIRYRDPTEEHPHNSWALVAFANVAAVDSMMKGQKMQKVRFLLCFYTVSILCLC